MDQPATAEGLKQAFGKIYPLEAKAEALDCLADLSIVAVAFRKKFADCRLTASGPKPGADVIKQTKAVAAACEALAKALNGLVPESLGLIGQVPESLCFHDIWSMELRHWMAGKAGEFFSVQDSEEEVDFVFPCEFEEDRLVPKGNVPNEAPMVQRLGHVAAIMHSISDESGFWAKEARKQNYAQAPETREAKAARDLITECGKVLLRRGKQLTHLEEITEAIYAWSHGYKAGTVATPKGQWQERGFRAARKSLGSWQGDPEAGPDSDILF